jgi:NAD(P)H-dependent FMN reductase
LLIAVTDIRILAVSGSLQASSTNAALLEIARARVGGTAEVVVFPGLREIPPFSPEIVSAPAAIDAWRALVSSSDALLIATPEYAHGLPGALKNVADTYESELNNALKVMMNMIEPVMIVVMAGGVGFLLLAVLSAMFAMTANIAR